VQLFAGSAASEGVGVAVGRAVVALALGLADAAEADLPPPPNIRNETTASPARTAHPAAMKPPIRHRLAR